MGAIMRLQRVLVQTLPGGLQMIYSPAMIECYAQRLLNPYRGVRYESAEAVTTYPSEDFRRLEEMGAVWCMNFCSRCIVTCPSRCATISNYGCSMRAIAGSR